MPSEPCDSGRRIIVSMQLPPQCVCENLWMGFIETEFGPALTKSHRQSNSSDAHRPIKTIWTDHTGTGSRIGCAQQSISGTPTADLIAPEEHRVDAGCAGLAPTA